MAEARELLQANQPTAAVESLEKALPFAEGDKSYLELLRTAYTAEMQSLQLRNADEKLLAGVRTKLQLIPGGSPPIPDTVSPAVEALKSALANTEIKTSAIPVISNVSATQVTDPAQIRELLGRQVGEPVLWEESNRRMGADGAKRFVEVGPGKVLSGLARKIVEGSETVNVESWPHIETWTG